MDWKINSVIKKGGKCGICGDPYNGARRFEKGGDLYRGYNIRTYKPGQVISVTVEVIHDTCNF